MGKRTGLDAGAPKLVPLVSVVQRCPHDCFHPKVDERVYLQRLESVEDMKTTIL
jgi:hypothetical protein